jgi:hypothetical protein
MVDSYDAGLLSDFGGGNVDWWQDYIRAELGRSHDFYAEIIAQQQARIAALEEHLITIFAHFDNQVGRWPKENAPGHGHVSPGIWNDDSSNGAKAGKPCKWCADWNAARQALASPENPQPDAFAKSADGLIDGEGE